MPRQRPKGAMKDEAMYVFLIKDTDKAGMLSSEQRKREIDAVNKVVKEEGGQCRLYLTRGAFDFVSVITSITPVAATRICAEIEKRGTVTATLMSGVEIFGDPEEVDATIDATERVRHPALAVA